MAPKTRKNAAASGTPHKAERNASLKAKSAYQVFCATRRADVLRAQGLRDLPAHFGEAAKLLAQSWDSQTEAEREPFELCAAVDRCRAAAEKVLPGRSEADRAVLAKVVGETLSALARAWQAGCSHYGCVDAEAVCTLEKVNRRVPPEVRALIGNHVQLDACATSSLLADSLGARLAALLHCWRQGSPPVPAPVPRAASPVRASVARAAKGGTVDATPLVRRRRRRGEIAKATDAAAPAPLTTAPVADGKTVAERPVKRRRRRAATTSAAAATRTASGAEAARRRAPAMNAAPAAAMADGAPPQRIDQAARSKLVGLLMQTFAKCCGKAELSRCQTIEDQLFELVTSLGVSAWREYKLRARSLIFNLRAADGTLLRRVLDGEVAPEDLVRLKPEELASDALKEERKRERERYFKSEVHLTERVPKRRRDFYGRSRVAERLAAGLDMGASQQDLQASQLAPEASQRAVPFASGASQPQLLAAQLEMRASPSAAPIATSEVFTEPMIAPIAGNDCEIGGASVDAAVEEAPGSASSYSSDSTSSSAAGESRTQFPTVVDCEIDEVFSDEAVVAASIANDEALARALQDLSSSASSSSSSSSSEEPAREEVRASPVGCREEKLGTIVTMGFEQAEAQAALVEAGGSLRRALSQLCGRHR